jgi:hypothetical protein
MRSSVPIVGLVLWAALTGAACAQTNLKVDCPQLTERKGTEHVYALKDVPDPIVKDLLRRFHDRTMDMPGSPDAENRKKLEGLADRDGQWNPYDTAPPWQPMRRFMQGGHEGQRWYLWYERGGYTRTVHAAIYELDREYPRLISQFSTEPEGLCSATLESFTKGVGRFYEADSW